VAKNTSRKLAAILAADVVGYSRLMGEGEAGTLDALRAHREELIEPKIAEHEGGSRRVWSRRSGAFCGSSRMIANGFNGAPKRWR
jgi:class 3 adenylate cyclase